LSGAAPPGSERGTGLAPVLGYRELVLYYVVAIFSVRLVPLAASIGPSVVVLWLVAALSFFVPTALAVVALSRRLPGEGGIYLWVRAAFGDFHGYLAAWTFWTSNLVYFPSVLLFAASQSAFVVPSGAGLAENRVYLTGFALVAMVAIFLLHFVGLRAASRLHALSALARFAVVALLVALGAACWLRFGSATGLGWSAWVPRLAGVRDLVFLSALAYSFAGAESAANLGDEVRDPRRDLPRAIFSSGLLLSGLYVLASLGLVVALPAERLTGLQGFTDALAAGADRLGGAQLSAIAVSAGALLLVVMAVGSVSAWFASAARLPFVIGLDRYLPPAFGRLHPRFGTPWVALGTLAGAALGFIVLGGLGGRVEQVYNILISLEIVVYFIPYLYLFAALLKLTRADSRGARVGSLAAGLVGATVTAACLVLALVPGEDVTNPATFYLAVFGSLAGNLATGIGLYWIGRRKRAAAGS